MDPEMGAAYERDSQDHKRMRELRDQILEFSAHRASDRTLSALADAEAALARDMAQIVRTWD